LGGKKYYPTKVEGQGVLPFGVGSEKRIFNIIEVIMTFFSFKNQIINSKNVRSELITPIMLLSFGCFLWHHLFVLSGGTALYFLSFSFKNLLFQMKKIMCCIWVGYKKCDIKNTEGMEAEQNKIQRLFAFSQKTGFCFVGL
jgi:hypothetical protein